MRFLSGLVLAMFMCSACSCAAVMPSRVSYLEDLSHTRAMQDATAGLVEERGLICAGAFISQDEVLTAAHCLRGAPSLGISIDEDGNLNLEMIPGEELPSINVVTRTEYNIDLEHPLEHSHVFDVVARDEDLDLVLLRAHGSYDSAHATLHAPTSTTQDGLSVGMETFAVGHPAGIGWNVSHGFMSRDVLPAQDGEPECVVSSSDIFFGNSGGPLMDVHGNLIGIAHAMPGNGSMAATFIGLFISPNGIVRFLESARGGHQA